MVAGHDADNLHGRSTGYNGPQKPLKDQGDRLEAFVGSWRNATAPRNRAAQDSCLLRKFLIYLEKKGK